MGWPSFYEDLVDRYNSDSFKNSMQSLKEIEISATDTRIAQKIKMIYDIHYQMLLDMGELMKYFEVLTNPDDISLVDQIKEYSEERAILRNELIEERRKNNNLNLDNDRLKVLQKSKNEEIKRLIRDNNKLERKIEDIRKERDALLDPDAEKEMYDKYLPNRMRN
jgi:hypothetical protein